MFDQPDSNKDWIVKYLGWQLRDNSLYLSCLTDKGWQAQLVVRAVSENIWNYTFYPPDSGSKNKSPLIPEKISGLLPLSVEENSAGIVISNGPLRMDINRNPWNLTFFSSSGKPVLSEKFQPSEICSDPQPGSLSYSKDENDTVSTAESFLLRQDEYVFGAGEHSVLQIRAGQDFDLWNHDSFSSDSVLSNKNIPFIFSSKGYGIFINSSSRIKMEFGKESVTSYRIFNDQDVLDIFVFLGDSPAEILERYTSLAGKPEVPPKWSFGLCVSANDDYLSTISMDGLIDSLHAENISSDVLLICPSSFNSSRYISLVQSPDLKKFLSRIHGRGFKIGLRIHPYIPLESELYHEAKLKDFLVKDRNDEVYIINYAHSGKVLKGIEGSFRCSDIRDARVAFVDFTNPDACAWFKKLYSYFFSAGTDLMSIEYGEDIPHDAEFFDGRSGKSIHNIYALLFQNIINEITSGEKEYGLIYTRSGTSGAQKNAVFWSQNTGRHFDHLACAVKRGISAGLSGLPFWGPCIDIISQALPKELHIRWLQFAMMCSHTRISAPVLSGINQMDEQTMIIFRKFLNLRYSLFPYIYSSARESSSTGIPVLRSMYLAFPGDHNTLNKDLQYMFGPFFLISPVFNSSGSVDVYLPRGEWFSLAANRKHSGGGTISLIVPLEEMPVFVRSGAIVPMMEYTAQVPESFIDPLILSIYPSCEKSAYTFYEDEGISEFKCLKSDSQVMLEIKGFRKRSYKLRLNGMKGFNRILVTMDSRHVEVKDYLICDSFVEILLPSILKAEVLID